VKDYISTEQQQPPQAVNVLNSVNWMSAGVATLLSLGMILDRHSVTVSVLSGVAFYGAIAGTLVATPLILNHQDQVTIRRRDEMPYRYLPQPEARVGLVDPVRLPVAASLPDTPRFVPAVPRIQDNIKVAAAGWVTQLFDTSDGTPLPTKITRNKGQVQIKSPEPEVVEYLASLGIVRVGDGKQLYWQMDTCPTYRYALNAIRTGVKPTPWQEDRQGGEGGVE
jgi:hypothetical protein